MKYIVIGWTMNLGYAFINLIAFSFGSILLTADIFLSAPIIYKIIGIGIITIAFLLLVLINLLLIRYYKRQNVKYNRIIYWIGVILITIIPYLLPYLPDLLNI